LELQINGQSQPNSATGVVSSTFLNTRTVLYKNSTNVSVVMRIGNPNQLPVYIAQGTQQVPISSTLVIEHLARS
jgi:hypothetical protein